MQVGEFAVSVAEISVDAATPGRMAGIIRIGQGEAFQDAELRFDQVEPGSFRRCPGGLDSESSQQSEETGMIVDVAQVVQNYKKSLSRIATTQAAKGFAKVQDCLATAEQATQAVCVYIVKSQELFGSFQAAIRRSHLPRAFLAGPRHTPDGLQIQRAPLVETHYRAMRRTASIERPDSFFLRSNAGSFEVFQVRTRWAVSPSRRSSRRTHSSVTGGSSFRRRQYSASLETDQTENGNPRSEGFDKATSTSSRSCLARRTGGRPFGLGTCSKVPNPLSLKRWTQSYATVKWQPTRSAASSRPNPRWTWSMTRYRWCTRTERVKSLSLPRNTRCSLRERGRSFRCRAILSSQGNRIAHIRLYKLERH